MDDKDRQLLILVQREIPLKSRPFEILGRAVGLHSADVLLRLHRLQEDKILGRISAIFDAERIGYRNYFAASQVLPEYADQAAEEISRHPGVTQCVKRSGEWNIWFSLCLPLNERASAHSSRLGEMAGCRNVILLQTVEIYKPLPVQRVAEKISQPSVELKVFEKQLLLKIQDELPLMDDPFARLGKELGVSEQFVLNQLQTFQQKGILKKIRASAISTPRKNPDFLVMWDVPGEKCRQTASLIANFSEVSFCLQRVAVKELPYSLHVGFDLSEEAIPAAIEKIEKKIGAWPRIISRREKSYKKVRPQYFLNEIENWRIQNEISSSAVSN